jgi:ABC-type Fe3+-siderophore transport system permease subunit
MACRITCAISLVFIVGMIYMTNAMSNNDTMQQYEKQLPEKLQKIYKQIVVERRQIYYTGYVLGFILAVLFILYNNIILNKSLSTISMVCVSTASAFLVNYFYYILTPKTTHMLEHADTPEQTKAWLKMYRTMQYHYHMGLFIGLIAVGVFAYAFRC